jgi:hypothetical protein
MYNRKALAVVGLSAVAVGLLIEADPERSTPVLNRLSAIRDAVGATVAFLTDYEVDAVVPQKWEGLFAYGLRMVATAVPA